MKRNYIKILPALVLAATISLVFSCKDPEPPKAKITVIDQNDELVDEAMVVIKAADSDDTSTRIYLASGIKEIADTSYTEDGVVRKEFLYESIYRVEVTKRGDNNTPTRRGIGVLILENDKTYEETITITPQTSF
ncbi:MAG: hypothetical protein ACLFM1_05170 [Bacteroidales bacterium]